MVFFTLYSHKHHLHAKYKYGGASNIIYLCSIRCKGYNCKITLPNTRLVVKYPIMNYFSSPMESLKEQKTTYMFASYIFQIVLLKGEKPQRVRHATRYCNTKKVVE